MRRQERVVRNVLQRAVDVRPMTLEVVLVPRDVALKLVQPAGQQAVRALAHRAARRVVLRRQRVGPRELDERQTELARPLRRVLRAHVVRVVRQRQRPHPRPHDLHHRVEAVRVLPEALRHRPRAVQHHRNVQVRALAEPRVVAVRVRRVGVPLAVRVLLARALVTGVVVLVACLPHAGALLPHAVVVLVAQRDAVPRARVVFAPDASRSSVPVASTVLVACRLVRVLCAAFRVAPVREVVGATRRLEAREHVKVCALLLVAHVHKRLHRTGRHTACCGLPEAASLGVARGLVLVQTVAPLAPPVPQTRAEHAVVRIRQRVRTRRHSDFNGLANVHVRRRRARVVHADGRLPWCIPDASPVTLTGSLGKPVALRMSARCCGQQENCAPHVETQLPDFSLGLQLTKTAYIECGFRVFVYKLNAMKYRYCSFY
eukprot:Rhum_TRINITY_DN15458_c4_g4::Rhum_TRINITY_DN15458_c4_g4_i5::g.158588::m.158588